MSDNADLLEPIVEVELPPHGFVRHIKTYGTDADIVAAARVSYGATSKGVDQDRKLLNRLYRCRHTSPFEMCSLVYNIRMPIFVMRQFVRHRTFRLNEVSARYTQLPDDFYLPYMWRAQGQEGNKQGSHIPTVGESMTIKEAPDVWDQGNDDLANGVYSLAYGAYEALIARGAANEQARMVLPVGIYTEIRVNCDLNNLTKFFQLRLDPHAQGEMQDVAKAMFKIFEQEFPWTAAAYKRYKFSVKDLEEEIK